MAAGGLFIGTSGWNYPAWRADFYEGVPQRKWLAHCAEHFTGIEVNGTFYRPFKPEIVARWFAGRRRRLNYIDVDGAGGLEAVLRRLNFYLKDPDLLAHKVYYR